MSNYKVTRQMLHDVVINIKGDRSDDDVKRNRVFDYLHTLYNTDGDKEAEDELVRYTREHFFSPYFKRWKEVNRTRDKFEKKFAKWLEAELKFPDVVLRCLPGSSIAEGDHIKKRGCSEVSSDLCSTTQVKRRKSNNFRDATSTSPLTFSSAMELREKEDCASAQLLTAAIKPTQSKGKELKPCTSMSPHRALSLIISENLTKKQYLTLRRTAREHGHNLYPSCKSIVAAKISLHPSNISITESKCEVPLQNLLDKTCQSIVDILSPLSEAIEGLTLTCKLGFDGSSGQHLLITSMAPIQLLDNSKTVLWKNPRTSSTRFCRPIRVQWWQETDEVSKAEEAFLKEQINQLTPYESKIGPINFSMHITTVDGKVCNALNNSSAMCCYVCGATPKEVNIIQPPRSRTVDTSKFQFGLSVLHAHIRFFECLLHIAYRLDVKTWKVSNDIKPLVDKRKKQLQDAFRDKMGLLVDVPKPGYGVSNDGNTARRFFKNPKLSAEICGIDKILIRRFAVILKAMSAGLPINIKKFETYCLDTAATYVKLYDWFYMPATVHKILIHGPAVIQNFMVPIGQMSEEASESKNKEFIFFRVKSSRENTNEDLFNKLLVRSDPLLSTISFRNLPKLKRSQIDPEVNDLLLIEENQSEDWSQEEDGEEDEEEESNVVTDYYGEPIYRH